jgi:pimeloyl-ACP methyl ester carboxylesterase
MRRGKTLTSAIAAAFAIMAVLGWHATDQSPMRRWLAFYAWKLISGKAHGGQCAELSDVCIYYETYGAGRPVLVLHGGLGSIEGMSYQIRALAASHLVVAADSRAHARSTDSSAPLSYMLMADDMVRLLDHLQLDRVDVVGWSDGGIIGLDLAMRYPERIRRLVAISANYDVSGLEETSAESSESSATETPPAPLRYRLFAPDPAHWPSAYRKVVKMWKTLPDYTLDDLGRIRSPTLVMAGEHDIIRREHTDQLAKAIPRSREVIIKGVGHSVPTDKPEEINSGILRFLDE